MDTLLRIISVLIGLCGLFIYFRSVIRVMLLNWRERDVISHAAGVMAVTVVRKFIDPGSAYERVQRSQAWVLPIFIVLSVASWFLLVQVSFTFILWGVGAESSFLYAFTASGSALSTLGFKTPPSWLGELLAIFEGAMGLAIVVLLFSFVPGYLAAVQARERKVGWLYARTGRHPTCLSLLDALDAAVEKVDDTGVWEEWESWFRGIYETHATAPILAYVPSIYRSANWVGASAAVLDTASLVMSALDAKQANAARICRHAGISTLELIANELGGTASSTVPGPRFQPQAETVFNRLYDKLVASGLSVNADKVNCRETFAALRAEYEPSLFRISRITLMPIEPPDLA